MDTSKLITVVIWGTLAFIAYEALKAIYGQNFTASGGVLSNQLGTSPTVPASTAVPALYSGTNLIAQQLSQAYGVLQDPALAASEGSLVSGFVATSPALAPGQLIANGTNSGYLF